MEKDDVRSPDRRSFLIAANGVAPLTALALGGAVLANAKSGGQTRWEPARHEKDNWLDETPARHRLVFDTIDSTGFAEALAFAANYVRVNHTEYGLENRDLAVVIVARHRSTPFAYNDAVWAKYGAAMAPLTRFDDPKTKQPPKSNVFSSSDYGETLPNRGTTLDSLVQQGVRFAVCGVATRAIAGMIARAVGGDADMINSELVSNLVGNARIVPAGIVAVSRAQERGYTLVRA